MASTYSDLLRLELISPGEQAGLWGNTTNVNLSTLLEQAIAGVTTVTLSSTADYTLTTTNGTPDEARSAVLVVGGTPGGATNIIFPPSQKWYIVKNGTAVTLTLKTAGQTGAPTLLTGAANFFYCDGANMYYGVQNIPLASGGTGGSDAASARTSLGVPSLSGTGATGTWGINVTGNAATVTNGVYTSDLSTMGGANKVPRLDPLGNMFIGGSTFPEWGSNHRILQIGGACGVWGINNTSPGSVGLYRNINFDTSSPAGAWKLPHGTRGAIFYLDAGTGSLVFSRYDGPAGTDTTAASVTFPFQCTATGSMIIQGSLTQSSDARRKTDLERIPFALDKVLTMQGYTYKRTDWDEQLPREMGLLAQDVVKVAPEVVREDAEAMLTVSYPNLVALLVEAIKELNGKVDALQMRVSELSGR